MDIKDVKLFNGILEHQEVSTDMATQILMLKALEQMPVMIRIYNSTYQSFRQKLQDSDTLIRAGADRVRLQEATLRDLVATMLARAMAVGWQGGAEYGHTVALGQMGGGSLDQDPEDILPSIY